METKHKYENWSRVKVTLLGVSVVFVLFFMQNMGLVRIPAAVQISSTRIFKCEEGKTQHCFKDNAGETWVALLPFASGMNQFLHLKAVLAGEGNFNVSFEVQLKHEFTKLNSKKISKTVECIDGVCEPVDLLHIPYLEFKSYIVEVTNLLRVPSKSIGVELRFVNGAFCWYLVMAAGGFAVLGGVFLLVFWKSFRGFEQSDEALRVGFVSFSLILFDLGAFFGCLLSFHRDWVAVAGGLKIQFLGVIFLYWVLRIRNAERVLMLIVEVGVIVFYCLMYFLGYGLLYENTEGVKIDLGLYEDMIELKMALEIVLVMIGIWIAVFQVKFIIKIDKNVLLETLHLVAIVALVIFVYYGTLVPVVNDLSLHFIIAINLYVFFLQHLNEPDSNSHEEPILYTEVFQSQYPKLPSTKID